VKKRVGVLALQGDFEAHGRALAAAGAEPTFVRTAHQLAEVDGLILPGGESTTMLKLLHGQEMFEPLREFGRTHPVFGTCAGVILMASHVTHPEQESLGLMDLTIERNGYGRQIDSTVRRVEASYDFAKRTYPGTLEIVFIRAPIIRECGTNVKVLAECQGQAILVEQNMHLGATFHPELSSDTRVHGLFLSKL
jgi:5'-phosphate synthase pdxT subunit